MFEVVPASMWQPGDCSGHGFPRFLARREVKKLRAGHMAMQSNQLLDIARPAGCYYEKKSSIRSRTRLLRQGLPVLLMLADTGESDGR